MPGATVKTRDSIDFLIDGRSLLDALVTSGGGHGDFMGCFVHGFPADNEGKEKQLTSADKPDTDSGRYLLYLCPECGDIGCGAYGAKIRFTDGMAEWYDFAYENGYARSYAAVSGAVLLRTA